MPKPLILMRRLWQTEVLVPLVIYALLVSWQAYRTRDQINPDAVSYLRNALYITEGRLGDSVSGYWSPLLSWCLAPCLYLGMDGLYAARITLAIWGAAVVLASCLLTRSLVRRASWIGLSGLSLVAADTALSATSVITPDLLMAALLLFYFLIVASPKLLSRRSYPVLAGLLGGAAYLAKSYALPFFVVHFTFSVVLHACFPRAAYSGGVPRWRNIGLAWGTGLAAFTLVTAPWIGILSQKYGHFTFSTVARVAHTVIGPADEMRQHFWDLQTFHVPAGRITVWETPDVLSYHHWSPLESWDYFQHQAKYSLRTAYSIIRAVGSVDLLGLTLPALVFLPVLLSRPEWQTGRRKATWLLGTVAIYASGFVLVYWEERYTRPILFPLCCLVGTAFGGHWLRRISSQLQLTQISHYLALWIMAASFIPQVAFRTLTELMTDERSGQTVYRQIAAEMAAAGCRGPIARLAGAGTDCSLFLAYHLDQPYVGCIDQMDAAEMERVLQEFGVQSLVVGSSGEASRKFQERPNSWQRRLSLVNVDGTPLYIYAPPEPAMTR